MRLQFTGDRLWQVKIYGNFNRMADVLEPPRQSEESLCSIFIWWFILRMVSLNSRV